MCHHCVASTFHPPPKTHRGDKHVHHHSREPPLRCLVYELMPSSNVAGQLAAYQVRFVIHHPVALSHGRALCAAEVAAAAVAGCGS